jgi:hypothetical protein
VKRSVVIAGALGGLALLPALGVLAQPATSPWVHIRIDEPRKPSKVSVNLPLTVVQAALRSAPESLGRHGRIELGKHGRIELGDERLSVAELRRLWNEVKSAGDADFATLEEEGRTVRIGRKADLVEVRIEKPRGSLETHVRVPVALVDALLSSQGDELNLEAAIAELQKQRGDIVQVNEDDARIRIWIDEANQ